MHMYRGLAEVIIGVGLGWIRYKGWTGLDQVQYLGWNSYSNLAWACTWFGLGQVHVLGLGRYMGLDWTGTGTWFRLEKDRYSGLSWCMNREGFGRSSYRGFGRSRYRGWARTGAPFWLGWHRCMV